jgi:hypothetical protein
MPPTVRNVNTELADLDAMDSAGLPLAEEFTWTFTTAGAP